MSRHRADAQPAPARTAKFLHAAPFGARAAAGRSLRRRPLAQPHCRLHFCRCRARLPPFPTRAHYVGSHAELWAPRRTASAFAPTACPVPPAATPLETDRVKKSFSSVFLRPTSRRHDGMVTQLCTGKSTCAALFRQTPAALKLQLVRIILRSASTASSTPRVPSTWCDFMYKQFVVDKPPSQAP